MNVGTKGNIPKQGLTDAKDLNIMLPEGHDPPYHRSDKYNYNLIYGSRGSHLNKSEVV